MLSENLIFFEEDLKNKEELFKFMEKKFKEKECITEEYLFKLIEREKKYPTGFKLEKINIAIPHTDPICAKKNQMIIIKLKNSIEFVNAEDGEDIKVNLILGLVFKNSDEQIEILRKIGEFLQNEDLQEKIKNCKTQIDFQYLMKKIFI